MKITETVQLSQNRAALDKMSAAYALSQTQLSTNQKHENFKTTRQDTYSLLHSQTQQERASALSQVTKSLAARTQRHTEVMEQIFEVASQYHESVITHARTGGDTSALQQAASQGKQELYNLLLSRDSQQRFIFGGQNSDVVPVVEGLTGIPLPAAGTTLDTAHYAKDPSQEAYSILENSEQVWLGVLATDPAVRDLLHTLLIGEQCPAGPVDASPNGQYMKQALQLCETSTRALQGKLQSLGQQQHYLESTDQRVQSLAAQSHAEIESIQGIDVVSIFQEMKEQAVLLQLLYRIPQMDNLEDFMRKLDL